MLKKDFLQIGFPIIVMGILVISFFTFGGTSNLTGQEGTEEATGLEATRITGIFLSLTGETQGDIEGSLVTVGHEGQIEVLATTHSVISPRDAASGLPTGKRQHKPITITKPIDKSTPLLYNVLVNNENIVSWKLDFYAPSKTGKEVNFYTVELVNAAIAGITQQTTANGMATERVSFAYQKIIWTWNEGGITAEDDWETPIA